MKKRSWLPITLLMVALLPALSIPAYANKPHITVGGTWDYIPLQVFDERWVGGNYFYSITDDGTWKGGFEGTSDDVGDVVLHSFDPGSFTFDSGNFTCIVSFDGEVWDESTDTRLGEGTLEMRVVGNCCDEEVGWQGKWVILSGSGDLVTLHGQGTWWGWGYDGVPSTPDIFYSGQVHQAPD